MSLIIPANSLAGGGYEIDNSLRFNAGSSDTLTKTFGTPTNNLIWSYSTWVKRSSFPNQQLFSAWINGSNFGMISFNSNASLDIASYIDGWEMRYATNRVFRDVGAWYHLCVTNDSSLSSPETKIYVNGVLETSFSEANPAIQNEESMINKSGVVHWVGQLGNNVTYLDGYMAETYFIDGQALTPTDFGEFDADSGVWKPIAYSGTYGTNGFFLEFQDSGALGTDSSGNGNNFTVNNLTSIDQTTDTPTNNFCTLNSLDNIASSTFTEGNLQIATGVSSDTYNTATFGMTTGKWYWEAKFLSSGALGNAEWGIVAQPSYKTTSGARLYQQSNSVSVNDYNYAVYANGSTTGISVGTYALNDFINFAYDADNNAFYIGRNGTWLNSGVPTSGASKTGAFTAGTSGITYFPAVGDQNGSNGYSFQFNFGNPPHTIASGNADANDYGNFEYAVPTGYLSLCTKNISEVNS